MFRQWLQGISGGLMLGACLSLTGCASLGNGGCGGNDCNACGSCDTGCESGGCGKKSKKLFGRGNDDCNTCQSYDGCSECDGGKKKKFKKCDGCSKWGMCGDGGGCGSICGSCTNRSLAIQDQYPIGSVMRSHFHQMQTNAEAFDFILFQKDFVGETAELTPDGKDKILEIAARMRSAPFPVLVERTWNNANPELDATRRAIVAQVLTDLGNTDANNRTIISPAYGPGKSSLEAGPEFYQHVYMGSGFGLGGGGGGGGGGGLGGGGGGGGFGGGGGGGGGF